MSLAQDETERIADLPLSALPITGAIICALCGFAGSVGWVFYILGLKGLPAQDWMVFYTAARAFLDGNLSVIFDGADLTAALNTRFIDWLASPLLLQPWVYPPSFLLLFMPFGLLPPAASFVLFQATGLVAAIVAVLRYAKTRHCRQMLISSLLISPAVPFNVIYGQNALFTSTLLIAGFGSLVRYPLLSGALLGLLTYKPQFWLMVPVALVAARQWRSLASAIVVALFIALVSLAVFGAEAWRAWLDLATGGEQYQGWAVTGRRNGISVFACAILLGAPAMLSNLVQAAAITVSAAFVYCAFRQSARGSLSLCVLLAGTILAAPHASAADAVLLEASAALFFATATTRKFRPLQAMLAATVWLCPFLNPPSVFSAGMINPVLLLLFLGCLVMVMRGTPVSGSVPAVPAPERASDFSGLRCKLDRGRSL